MAIPDLCCRTAQAIVGSLVQEMRYLDELAGALAKVNSTTKILR